MVEPTRLDSYSMQLAAAFWKATPEHRRKAVLRACELAVTETRLHAVEVEEAMAFLRSDTGASAASTRERMLELASELDEMYFALSESEGTEPQALERFAQARSASAVALALAPQVDELHEAIYEAGIATDWPREFVEAVLTLLAGDRIGCST